MEVPSSITFIDLLYDNRYSLTHLRKSKCFKRGFVRSTGLDGRACVMKALCEAAQRSPQDVGKGSLVQELLHAIFTWVSRLLHRYFDYSWTLVIFS